MKRATGHTYMRQDRTRRSLDIDVHECMPQSPCPTPLTPSCEALSTNGMQMNLQTSFVDPPVRVKKKHRKTRTGCVTCKLRRVKCDETKPICDKCRALDKHCFYRPVPKSSGSRDLSKEFSRNGNSPTKNPMLELALFPIERTPETAQLQQFCMSTSLSVFKNLGRPFETFWTSAVPKLSFSEPCVAHIMVALAARQRASFYVNSAMERPHLIKIYNQHYMDALALLTDPVSQSKPEMILLCCLMFISMENVDDTVSNSFLHLRSGLQVLREWKSKRKLLTAGNATSGDELIQETLEPMFARFEAAVSPSIYIHHKDRPPDALDWAIPELPESFESLATARGFLYEIAQWVFSQGNHQMIFQQPHSQEFRDTLDLCLKWRTLLEKYQLQHPNEKEIYKSAILALQTNHQLLVLLIKCTTIPNELLWGSYSTILDTILQNIETLDKKGLSNVPQRRTPMNLLPRMMPALFAVSIISRRKATKERALELIKQIHSENHKDECFVAVIAKGVIQLEEILEQGSIMQLSTMDTRIRPIMAELVPGWPGKVVLTYTRPFVRPLIEEDPILGPIVVAAPTDKIELSWKSREAPPSRVVWLWPVIEFLRLAGSSGLVGPNTGHCLCKTYGALFALMR